MVANIIPLAGGIDTVIMFICRENYDYYWFFLNAFIDDHDSSRLQKLTGVPVSVHHFHKHVSQTGKGASTKAFSVVYSQGTQWLLRDPGNRGWRLRCGLWDENVHDMGSLGDSDD